MTPNIDTLPDYFRELLLNSRQALVQNKELHEEVKELKEQVSRQNRQISALQDEVKSLDVPADETSKEEVWMNQKQAAAYLNRHYTTLARWENNRQLMPKRIGGAIYYAKSQLDKKK